MNLDGVKKGCLALAMIQAFGILPAAAKHPQKKARVIIQVR
jgi:hypothetical protein